MRAAVGEWLAREGLMGDAGFYSVEQWRVRGEPYLNDSLLVLIFDGSTLHTLLNYGGDHDEFDDLVESFGYYYELGNSWNLGFYEIPGYDFSPVPTDYGSKLKDARWRAKAAHVKRRAGERCEDCGATASLEAHHCYYATMREGFEPWEYPLGAFGALCRQCHVSRATVEIRMRALVATLPQAKVERLRQGLGRAFAFYDEDAFLTFLERIGPGQEQMTSAIAALALGLRPND